jgi:hypothetical protein
MTTASVLRSRPDPIIRECFPLLDGRMRIRTVKPEFWDDDTLGAISRDARLLFIATWNLADDEGILRWTAPFLKASAFMYDDDVTEAAVSGLMAELVAADLIFPYTAGRARQRLGLVVNFRKHQKINRPQPGKFPPPPVADPTVIAMYARRDDFVCHLCGSEVNREPANKPLDPYDPTDDADDLTALNASPDHVVPRALGGTDSPSNIRTAHLGCNKSRRDRPIDTFTAPRSVTSLTRSVNAPRKASATKSRPRSLAEGKGREGKGSKKTSPTGSAARATNSVSRSVNDSVNDPGPADPPTAPRSAGADATEITRAQTLTKVYAEAVPLSNFPAVMGIVRKAIRSGRYSDGAIEAALLRLAADGRPVTVDTLRTELDGLPAPRSRQSTTDQRVAEAQSLKERMRAKRPNPKAIDR